MRAAREARLIVRSSPTAIVLLTGVVCFAIVAIAAGVQPASQAALNGLVSGAYIGLGAIGLTLVFGVLHLVNFAHGDLLTLGAYVALGLNVVGIPFPMAALTAILATAALSLVLEAMVWRPMRKQGAGTFQLFLTAIGVALVLRFTIQFFAGSQARTLGLDTLSVVQRGGLHAGTLQLVALVVGLATMVALGVFLRHARLGKEMRGLADNRMLADVVGIDTQRVIAATWVLSGALAALAGILYAAAIGSINPNFGLTLLLSLFAASILGGIGNAYGALVGGFVIGLSQEWATLFVSTRWKPAVGFAILILTLIVLPNGIFGRRGRTS